MAAGMSSKHGMSMRAPTWWIHQNSNRPSIHRVTTVRGLGIALRRHQVYGTKVSALATEQPRHAKSAKLFRWARGMCLRCVCARCAHTVTD